MSTTFWDLDAKKFGGLKFDDEWNLAELQDYGPKSPFTVVSSSPAATSSFKKTAW